MKLTEHFNAFMNDVVNLNTTRFDQLETSVSAIKSVITSANWKPKVLGFAGHGSWAHKTIIRPIEGKAFDADLIVFLDPVPGWSAKDYISALRSLFASHTVYGDKVRRFSHCVTIEYAGERKIDIAPCIKNREGRGFLEVCNFNSDRFERSEPVQYTTWLIDRNGWTGNNGLRKATRLLKYLRDIKTTFTCPSILLTTLLGNTISMSDADDTKSFADLPTALKTICGRLDDFLQGHATKPWIVNPVLQSEIFSEMWDDVQYENFRTKFHTYRQWIDDAYAEEDRDESIGKWQRVFGDEFAAGAVKEKAERVSASLTEAMPSSLTKGLQDLASQFVEFGRRVLPANFDRLPHKKRPLWKEEKALLPASVEANEFLTRNGAWLSTVDTSRRLLPKRHWLRFDARTSTGMPFGPEFKIFWRVTNTDTEASRANCLRGGFEKANDGMSHWEQLQYRGVHSVEAFVVRKRDEVLVAVSPPFYVPIS